MARRAKLKVYRTPTGFHDAYVAAPSQKAALAAWGSDHDLFARGVAEQVTDPELMKEPLARPGEVVKRLRGTAAEQIAALPKEKPAKRTAGEGARRSASNRLKASPGPTGVCWMRRSAPKPRGGPAQNRGKGAGEQGSRARTATPRYEEGACRRGRAARAGAKPSAARL